MELKPGYKRTNVGVIPKNWEVRALGSLGDTLIGLTYKPEDVSAHGTLVLRSSNIQNDALSFLDNVYVQSAVPERIMVRDGDVLICVRNGSRDLIGKSVLLDERTSGMTFGAFMAVFRSSVGPYVSYLFLSPLLKNQIGEHLGATINQITNRSLSSFMVPLPSSATERRAIVEVLQNTDDFVVALERLIAKKRHLKQAAMQQLLTGKTRLPGYTCDWEAKRLGNVLTLHRDSSVSSPLTSEVLCVELEHIKERTGQMKSNRMVPRNTIGKLFFRRGDVLFGRLRPYLRKYWSAACDGVCSPEIFVMRADSGELDSQFLFQLVQTESFIEAASSSFGTHMPRSDWKLLRSFEFLLPLMTEQRAIAAVLSSMDAEIAALEARLRKTRALKEGMMQELLTGRIRLVGPEVSYA